MDHEYSLLVVDDEPLAREHIVKMLDWDRLGITSLYTAGNGFEAIECVRTTSPDIMILDIRMPQMNGMELLSQIREMNADIQIIVSSGYTDFEAARQMLSSGRVVEYLLKPVTTDLLFEAVYKCIVNIDEKRSYDQIYRNFEDAQGTLRKNWFRNQIFSYPQEEPETQIQLSFCLIAVCFFPNEEKASLARLQSEDIPENIRPEYVFLCPNPSYAALLFQQDTPSRLQKTALSYCHAVSRGQAAVFGLSHVCTDPENLNLSYQEALLACEANRLSGRNVSSFEEPQTDDSAHSDWDLWAVQMKHHVVSRDRAAIKELLQHIAMITMQKKASNLIDAQRSTLELAMPKARVVQLLESVLSEKKEKLNLSPVFNARSYLEIYDKAEEILTEQGNLDQENYRSDLIRQIKTYVRKNCGNRITLENVAGMVYLNPSYFSRIFSESEGCGFVEYLTGVRMEKAKELLVSTDYKIYEIAEQVGYNNVKYFIRVFKDKTKLTPVQYREKHIFDALG